MRVQELGELGTRIDFDEFGVGAKFDGLGEGRSVTDTANGAGGDDDDARLVLDDNVAKQVDQVMLSCDFRVSISHHTMRARERTQVIDEV